MFSGKQISVLAWFVAIAAVLCGAGAVQALISGTYLDADTGIGGNTVRTSDGTDGPTGGWSVNSPTAAGATQWADRSDTSPKMGAYVIENNATTTQSAPEITTTITGLDPAWIYNIYVIYYTVDLSRGDLTGGSTPQTGFDWQINAGLTAGGLTHFDSSNGAYTGLSESPSVTINQREGLVGQVSHVSSASIFVDDNLHVTLDDRTRYDGVAFEFAGFAPEPASLSMIALGGGMLLRRRRK